MKQEAAARKRERSAFRDQLSASGRQTAAFAEEAIGVGQTGFERQSTCPPAAHTTAAGAEGRDDAVAEELRGVDQGRPAEAGTPTSRAVAEESRGVDQGRPAEAGTPTSAAFAEKSRGVDQGDRARITCATFQGGWHVVERSEGRGLRVRHALRSSGRATQLVQIILAQSQTRPAEAGTPTSRAVAEESRGVDQRRPAEAGTPTSRAVAEESRGVDQGDARE